MERSGYESWTWREWAALAAVVVLGVAVVRVMDDRVWAPAVVLAGLIGLGLWQRRRDRRGG